nr:hypothetical protein [Tanacetum cinerariifolium]
MEGNKSIQRSDEQRNLYKGFLDTYGDSTILKRRREDDDQEGPSAGSDRGSKRQKEGGEHASASTPSETATRGAGRTTKGSQSRQLSTSESAYVEEPAQTTCQMEEPPHPVFETGVDDQPITGGLRDKEKEGSMHQPALHLNQLPRVQAGAEDQPIVQTTQHPKWFSQLRKLPTPDRDWNKTLPAIQGSAQSWISELASVDTLAPELLAGPTYELMRGSCNSLTELEYHLEEVYKAMTDKLDWVNPEGQQYPHNLLQPLPLIQDNRGRRVISFEHFINNDLEYLRGGASSRKYTTSVTKTKAADYGL